MPDMLDLNETAFATLIPEQRLMAAIIRRAVADLPISRRFFETHNGMFRLCCEAFGMDSDEVRAQIEKKFKSNTKWMWRSVSATSNRRPLTFWVGVTFRRFTTIEMQAQVDCV